MRLGRRIIVFFSRLLRILSLAGILALAVGLVWALHGFLFRSEFFEIKTISISRDSDEPTVHEFERIRFEILNRLRKAGLNEGNLLGLDLEAGRRTVEGHSKVRKAHLNKHYPDDLEIRVELREIVALLLNDPILAVDREGVIVQTLTTRTDLAARYPYVTGLELGQFEPGDLAPSESLTKALDLLSLLEDGAPALHQNISEAHCDEADNLTLLLKGGTEIRFGNGDPVEKMPALETFLQSEPGQPEKSAYIDLRVPDRVYSLSKTEAAKRKTPENQ